MWRKALIVVLLLSFSILLVQPAAAQNPTYIAYYFNNGTLEGSPVLTRNETSIGYNWGESAPIAGLNVDNFSIRWATDVSLTAGTYRFYALADDNIRVIFNFGLTPVIDTYGSGVVGQLVTSDLTVPSNGVYHIQIDYRELSNNAFAYFSFANLASNPSGPGFPVPGTGTGTGSLPPTVATSLWTAQYYANGGLLGDPSAILTETSPSHSWGQSAPLPNLPADNFSVRWSSVQTLGAGNYTVAARADDGVRVFVNGVLLINQFGGATGQTYTATLQLPAGGNTFQVEYNDQTLDAYIEFSVYFTSNPGGIQPTQVPVLTGAVATVTAFRLNVRDLPNSTTSNVITRINRLEQYQVLGRTANSIWYQIRLNNGASGWVSGRFVSIANGFNIPVITPDGTPVQPTVTPPANPGTGIVVGIATPFTVNVRSGPGTQFGRVARIVAGGTAPVIGRNTASQWYQVNFNGIVGWVSAQYFVLPAGTNVNSIPVTG